MIAIPSRHKSLTLLAGVIVVQVLLLAAQIKREQQVRLIRVWAVELVSPLQRIAAWSINGAAHGWGGYVGLRTAQKDNDSMRAELERLKIRNAELEGRALEADRLAALLNFHNTHAETPMLAAHVIGGSPDSGSQIVNIDRGSRDGIRRDMGVITPDGVVGKIFAVYPDMSQVLLMGDKESGVGALLADTRTQGPVKGTGGPLLSLDYISNDEKVTNGRGGFNFGAGPHLSERFAGGHGCRFRGRSENAIHAHSREAVRAPRPPGRSVGSPDKAGFKYEKRPGCGHSSASVRGCAKSERPRRCTGGGDADGSAEKTGWDAMNAYR